MWILAAYGFVALLIVLCPFIAEVISHTLMGVQKCPTCGTWTSKGILYIRCTNVQHEMIARKIEELDRRRRDDGGDSIRYM